MSNIRALFPDVTFQLNSFTDIEQNPFVLKLGSPWMWMDGLIDKRQDTINKHANLYTCTNYVHLAVCFIVSSLKGDQPTTPEISQCTNVCLYIGALGFPTLPGRDQALD